MYDTVHMVLPGTQDLVSPYLVHPGSRLIRPAESFSVSVDTVVVAEDLDGLFASGNDLLVLTRSALGDRPRIERVHFLGEDIEPGRPLRNMFANLAHVCEDYQSTERLWLEFVVLEIDSDQTEREVAVQAFRSLAATAGAAFPVLLPYTTGAANLAGLVHRVIDVLRKDTQVVRTRLAFHGGTPRPGQIPLQEGSFVVFPKPTRGEGLRLAPNGLLLENDRPSERTYAVFNLFVERQVSQVHLTSQRVATLLTQLRDGNDDAAPGTIGYLRSTVDAYADVKRLRRYQELTAKARLSDVEESVVDAIRSDPRLKPFLERSGGRAAPVRVRTF